MKILIAAFLLLISSCEKGDNSSWSSVSQPATDDTSNPVDTGTDSGTDQGTADQTMTEEFMELINNHRISIGLQPLVHDEGMGLIAQGHSEDMADGSVAFGHDGFSTRCSEARAVLGGGNLCAENVAMGQKTVLAAFNAWMNSSGHKANIEQPRATHTGFGYKKSASGAYYWTQIFLEKN